ncbi:hypothetical protein BDZ89DRAFT_1060610 [Hymenopellis radicata]|nr:hypothetical protein BDZ89DRAFT_1060610 [Hymenopellis radicata]
MPLIDRFVDGVSTDRSSLLTLLQSARVFGERCRLYLYHTVSIKTTSSGDLTAHSRLLYDHLLLHPRTGRFVCRVEYKFYTPVIPIPPIQPFVAFVPTTEPPLKPGDGVPLSPMIPELARCMPNVREVHLDGLDCSTNAVPEASVRSLTKLSMHRSCWAGDAVKQLYYFLCECPQLTSLELRNVALSNDTDSSGVAPSITGALTCPSLVNLTLTDRDHTFFYLIPAGIRRFFVLAEVESIISPNKGWPLIQKTVRYLADQLTLLFISPPYNLIEGLIVPIFRIPHVVISFRQAIFSMSYRLKTLDVVCGLYDLYTHMSANQHVLSLRTLGDLLNSFVQESMVVRIFIVTEADPPGRYDDGTGPIIYNPLGTMRKIKEMMVFGDKPDTHFMWVKTITDRIHFSFMHEQQ